MSATAKPFVVYGADLEQLACFMYPDHAAAFVSVLGEGATIRLQARGGSALIVWREGHEKQSASESYDEAATTMMDRATASMKAAKKPTGDGWPTHGSGRGGR